MFLKHDFTILIKIVFSKQDFDHVIIYNSYVIIYNSYIIRSILHVSIFVEDK